MNEFHGVIFAYSAAPSLHELVETRTAASLPFCGRYRLIDFALSSMRNAGIRDVGVILKRDYQSLLDHIGSGKAWDMSLNSGGLRMLPPFGLSGYHTGDYEGTMEALNAIYGEIKRIPQKYVVLMQGSLVANIDLNAAMEQHIKSGLPVTAICCTAPFSTPHYRYIPAEDGTAASLLLGCTDGAQGYTAMEAYIVGKDTLLAMMERCRSLNQPLFHRDGIMRYLAEGGKMGIYLHKGYSAMVRSTECYYAANMDALRPEVRRDLFPEDRPVRTRGQEEVSTYYGEKAVSRNSLVADNCIIEGSVENCIIFSGVKVGRGAVLRNSIIMNDTVIGDNSVLDCVISDKHCTMSEGTQLRGSEKLPFVIPNSSRI